MTFCKLSQAKLGFNPFLGLGSAHDQLRGGAPSLAGSGSGIQAARQSAPAKRRREGHWHPSSPVSDFALLGGTALLENAVCCMFPLLNFHLHRYLTVCSRTGQLLLPPLILFGMYELNMCSYKHGWSTDHQANIPLCLECLPLLF